MNSVLIKQGEDLIVNIPSLPFTASIRLSYEQLIDLINSKVPGNTRSRNKSRRSSTEGTLFSRKVRLYTKALDTGVWSTGGSVDISEMTTRFQKTFDLLPKSEYVNVTARAIKTLKSHSLEFVRQMAIEIEREINAG